MILVLFVCSTFSVNCLNLIANFLLRLTGFGRHVLWNTHVISICWGSMFVKSQSFSGSWGRNFVGNAIGMILIDIKQMAVYRFVGM